MAKLMLGETFYMAVEDDYLDHHMDDSNTKYVERYASEALACAVRDGQEHGAPRAIVYMCVPIGEVGVDGRVIDWAETGIERMARCAAAL